MCVGQNRNWHKKESIHIALIDIKSEKQLKNNFAKSNFAKKLGLNSSIKRNLSQSNHTKADWPKIIIP